MEVLHTLETAALRYREATGQSPTLVIDGVERLGTRDAAAFQALLQGAREAAGRGALSTVLVCGDGHVLRDMRGKRTGDTERKGHMEKGGRESGWL
jgi:hypothetical protein